jgi:hypothetical protein
MSTLQFSIRARRNSARRTLAAAIISAAQFSKARGQMKWI